MGVLQPKIIPISAPEMRAKFNQRNFDSALRSGTVVAVSLYRAPADPAQNQPRGTMSLMLSYRDARSGAELARVHQYLRPDGTLGGSGLPDPKRLLDDGVVYVLA